MNCQDVRLFIALDVNPFTAMSFELCDELFTHALSCQACIAEAAASVNKSMAERPVQTTRALRQAFEGFTAHQQLAKRPRG